MTIALPRDAVRYSGRPRRIAVVGAGIAGGAAALSILHADAPVELVVYERAARPGGHAATFDVDYDGVALAVDTGFIVYNETNYPNLTDLFHWLGVATQPSDMSFSVSGDDGRFEWSGRSSEGDARRALNALFATRRHLVSPRFYRLLYEIVRFEKQATTDVRRRALGAETLGDWLSRHGFSVALRENYVAPMGAAIWSMSPRALLDFPACAFLEFFANHALLQRRRPQWRTICGGSRSYVRRLASFYTHALRLDTIVRSIRRTSSGLIVSDARGGEELFDEVAIAAHAPQALAMLAEPTRGQYAALGAFRTSANDVFLHRDPRFMPRRTAAWAAWNFQKDAEDATRPPTVTYWMNVLQGLDMSQPLFVTLNPRRPPDPKLTFAHFVYDHPQYDAETPAARRALDAIQGVDGLWFCGAWTGNGFHEDGLCSGLATARALGGREPWRSLTLEKEAAE